MVKAGQQQERGGADAARDDMLLVIATMHNNFLVFCGINAELGIVAAARPGARGMAMATWWSRMFNTKR
eukprot:5891615-Karenia_brevis.AAC.1